MDISVIIPVYNVEQYLEQCLDSVVNQNTSLNIEIICINDGSTDNSLEILKAYEKVYPTLKVISQKNQGLSKSRNIGIKHASGTFLTFLDSDDYLTSKTILDELGKIAVKEELDILIADFDFSYEDQTKNKKFTRNVSERRVISGKEFYQAFIETETLMPIACGKLYKTTFLKDNILYFYEGIFHEDEEFTPKAYVLAKRVKYVPKSFFQYRQREGSITSQGNGHRLKDLLLIARSLKEFNEVHQNQSVLRAELNMYVHILRQFKNSNEKNEILPELKKNKIGRSFIKSKYLKYKAFGVYCSLKYFIY